MRNPELSNNTFPNKFFDIYIPNISQRFNFDPLGEIICATSRYLLFPITLGKGPTISSPY